MRAVFFACFAFAGFTPGVGAQTTPPVADPLALPVPRPASKGAYQYGIEMLKLDRAWNITKGRAHVSTVDTGFIAHPELSPGIDGNFRTHLSQTAQQPASIPNYYHATLAAGVLAARGFDGKGMSGACPWCSLSIHVGSPVANSIAIDVANGTRDAIASGATVINMSFGDAAEADAANQRSCDNPNPNTNSGAASCAAMRRTDERDIVVVSIAQNNSNGGAGAASDRAVFPANYPSVIAVGGVDSTGNFWSGGYESGNTGSNWSAKIRLVAPAKDVLMLQVQANIFTTIPRFAVAIGSMRLRPGTDVVCCICRLRRLPRHLIRSTLCHRHRRTDPLRQSALNRDSRSAIFSTTRPPCPSRGHLVPA